MAVNNIALILVQKLRAALHLTTPALNQGLFQNEGGFY